MNLRQRLLIAVPLLIAVSGVLWGMSQRESQARSRNFLEAVYQRQFYNLIDQTEQLEVTVGKAVVSSTTGQQAAYLTEAWMRASQAQESLSHLPLRRQNQATTVKFLSQLGDYARVLAREAADGKELSRDQLERLESFEKEMARISGDLHALRTQLSPERFRWTASLSSPPKLPREPDVPTQTESDEFQAFTDIEERLRQFPTLIYDGPFSDHLEEIEPKGVTGGQIEAEAANDAARRFMDTEDPSNYRALGDPRRVEGRIPAFNVNLRKGPNGPRITLDISRQGGHVVWMLNTRPLGSARLDSDEAIAKAQAFLRERGLTDLVPIHSLKERNVLITAFAARQDGVILYPDQVKLKVALDDGSVIGYDATAYLTSHHRRSLGQPRLTRDAAVKIVGGRLPVTGSRLVLIPAGGGREVLAYEVRVRREGTTYLVYINSDTGKEEVVLKVVNTPNGELIM